MSFRITGLDPAPFRTLHAMPEQALLERGVRRVRVDSKPSAPCRVSLDDAEVGETVLLLSFEHQPARTPYRQHGPIFVRATEERFDSAGVLAPALAKRTLSLRGFDRHHMMIEADLAEGNQAATLITRILANPDVDYIHAHYARRGCFAALVTRA
jgi:hypothetical protein